MTQGDLEAHRALLHAYARRHGLEVFAYCLMPNHVHLVLIPASAEGMHRALQAVFSQYAQRINRIRAISGHLWQGRYHSCALDTRHFLNAIRYTEQNPVKAGMVTRAEDYVWSSAAARCGLRFDPLIEPRESSSLLAGIANWSDWLARGVPDDCAARFQRHECRNLPCGSDQFVAELEKSSGCELRLRTRGGQRKA